VAQERGDVLGGEVGFRTAFEKKDSIDTKLLFCTDGLQMVRELTGQGVQGEKMALVLDEVHEWNINMEVLVAWAKKQKELGKEYKIVLMSATLDSQKLSEFFGNQQSSAPCIQVPGKLFPVEEKECRKQEMISHIASFAKEGKNVLVFQPGKKEIAQTIEALESLHLSAEILPLHGELDALEQQKVFAHYDRPKIIVATNIAQTSLTIDDIDVVVDSGEERRVETRNGVEGVYLSPISKADCQQRKGRAGRCRAGVYLLCSDVPLQNRELFPVPEIERIRLDQMVLRLAHSSFDAPSMDFFHQPDKAVLNEAKRSLIALGAMNEEGEITPIGNKISMLPLDVHIGRMLLEAEKHNCVHDVLTIAACMEAGGLRDRTTHWKTLTQETSSDLLAECEIYKQAQRMKPYEMKNNGIFVKSFFRAKEIREHLWKALQKGGRNFQTNTTANTNKESLLRSIAAGMVDHLYKKDCYNEYSRNRDTRLLGKESVVTHSPQWIVGIPKNIEFENRRGYRQTLKILTSCSEVSPEWLIEVAPQLVQKKRRFPVWSEEHEEVREEEYTIFNGNEVKQEDTKAEKREETVSVFYKALLAGRISSEFALEIYNHNIEIRRKARVLWVRSGGAFTRFQESDELEMYAKAFGSYAPTTKKEFELLVPEKISLESLKIDYNALISPEERRLFEEENPLEISVQGKVFPVSYQVSSQGECLATIQVTASDVDFFPLDQEKLLLPSGREVTLSVSNFPFASFETKNIQTFHTKIERNRLEKQWSTFLETHENENIDIQSEFVLPPLEDPKVYDEKTGNMAYSGYSFRWGNFSKKWFRSEEEANEHTQEALQYKKEKETKFLYNTIEEKIYSLSLTEDTMTLEDYAFAKNRITEMKTLLFERKNEKEALESLVQKLQVIEEFFVKAQEKKEKIDEEERNILKQQEENGEILINFQKWYRRVGMSGQSEAWVITPEGRLRSPDIKDIPRHKTDGMYIWHKVEADELALSWGCGSVRDVQGSSDFSLDKLPVHGLTLEQKEAVRMIEQDIGVNMGSFGLNADINQEKEAKIQAIIASVSSLQNQSVDFSSEHMDWFDVCSENGYRINHLLNMYDIEQSIDWSDDFSFQCEDRKAQCIHTVKIFDGVLEFLVYEKWGQVNVNMRFQKREEASYTEQVREQTPEKEIVFKDVYETESVFAQKLKAVLEGEETGSENIHHEDSQDIVKKKKKKKGSEEIEEISFGCIENASEDELYDEYEKNESMITAIYEQFPDIDEIFNQLDADKASLQDLETMITEKIHIRDISQGKRYQSAIQDLENFRIQKKDLKISINNTEKRIHEMKKEKTRLDALRNRQEDIEEKLNSVV
jgi:HrpA-like RNA helicase